MAGPAAKVTRRRTPGTAGRPARRQGSRDGTFHLPGRGSWPAGLPSQGGHVSPTLRGPLRLQQRAQLPAPRPVLADELTLPARKRRSVANVPDCTPTPRRDEHVRTPAGLPTPVTRGGTAGGRVLGLPQAQATTQPTARGARVGCPGHARSGPGPRARAVGNTDVSRCWVLAGWHEPVSQTRDRAGMREVC